MLKPISKVVTFEIESLLLGRMTEITGYEIVPGIAVHKDPHNTKQWRVSHTISGLGLVLQGVGSFSTRKKAVEYTQKLISTFPNIDWTKSGKDVDADVTSALLKIYNGTLPKGGRHKALKELLLPKKNAPQDAGR